MNLAARLDKLESKARSPKKTGRVIRLVASSAEEAEARKLLKAEGFDPDSGDIGIIRLIAPPPGQKPYSKPPRVISRTEAEPASSRTTLARDGSAQ